MKATLILVVVSAVTAAVALGPVVTAAYNGVMAAFKLLGVGLP